MKLPMLTLSLLIASSATAQTSPTHEHPPVGGHPTTGTAADGSTGHPARPAPAGAPHGMPHGAPMQANTGTVLSIQQSGGYSYIEVSGAQGNTWIAAPMASVKVGDRIQYEDGATMRNFSSKSLGRTFPTILFVGSVSLANQAAAPVAAPAPQRIEGVVISAQDAGGYSYIEVKTASGNTWLAGPTTPLKAGDAVQYEVGAVMSNFSSKALNRTFPSIIFVDQVIVVPPAAKP